MVDFSSFALRLSVIIVIANVFLALNGFVSIEKVQNTYRIIDFLDLTDTNSDNFQQSTISGTANNLRGQSVVQTLIDLLAPVPILGPLVSLVSLVYSMIIVTTFGLSIVLGAIGAPAIVAIPITVTMVISYVVTAYEFLADFLGRRGGSR